MGELPSYGTLGTATDETPLCLPDFAAAEEMLEMGSSSSSEAAGNSPSPHLPSLPAAAAAATADPAEATAPQPTPQQAQPGPGIKLEGQSVGESICLESVSRRFPGCLPLSCSGQARGQRRI